MDVEYLLFHHKNMALANYVIECSDTLKAASTAGKVNIKSLPQQHIHKGFATLPTSLRRLLFYARPDLVICINDGIRPTYPIFAFEITDHVPAQDHWMQRFNHLVGCAEEGVPGAYILPFSMPKHPKFPSQLDHVFFYAYDRVTEIHETPMFIADWEVAGGHTPRGDKSFPSLPDRNLEDLKTTFSYLEKVIEYAVHGRSLKDLIKERIIINLRNKIRLKAYSSKIPEIKDFERLAYNMPSNRALNEDEFKDWLKQKGLMLPPNLPDRVKKRGQYHIFVPQARRGAHSESILREKLKVRISQKGGDPYLGQPLAFDYMFCRLGETTYQRDSSLVIDLSVLSFSDMAHYHRKIWESSPMQYTDIKKVKDIPTYTMYLKEGSAQVLKNVLRIYAFAADIIVYKDGVVLF